jgi:predicted transcriptional regulator
VTPPSHRYEWKPIFKERLVRYAEQQECSVSWVIKKAVAEYLDRNEDKEFGPMSRKEAAG